MIKKIRDKIDAVIDKIRDNEELESNLLFAIWIALYCLCGLLTIIVCIVIVVPIAILVGIWACVRKFISVIGNLAAKHTRSNGGSNDGH